MAAENQQKVQSMKLNFFSAREQGSNKWLFEEKPHYQLCFTHILRKTKVTGKLLCEFNVYFLPVMHER